jgi:hypothetical protein
MEHIKENDILKNKVPLRGPFQIKQIFESSLQKRFAVT